MLSLFVAQLGSDLGTIAANLGSSITSIFTHLATLTNGTV